MDSAEDLSPDEDLPEGWAQAHSRRNGQPYYINTLTNGTQFDYPKAPAELGEPAEAQQLLQQEEQEEQEAHAIETSALSTASSPSRSVAVARLKDSQAAGTSSGTPREAQSVSDVRSSVAAAMNHRSRRGRSALSRNGSTPTGRSAVSPIRPARSVARKEPPAAASAPEPEPELEPEPEPEPVAAAAATEKRDTALDFAKLRAQRNGLLARAAQLEAPEPEPEPVEAKPAAEPERVTAPELQPGPAPEPELPEGWEAHVSRSTRETYYFNEMTGESSFERPEPELVAAEPEPVAARAVASDQGDARGRARFAAIGRRQNAKPPPPPQPPPQPELQPEPLPEPLPQPEPEPLPLPLPEPLPLPAPELPEGWEAHVSRSTGETYYVNEMTGESSFDRPEPEWEPGPQPGSEHELPEGWEAHVSRSTGETYYFNEMTDESSFERPEPERQPRWKPEPAAEPDPELEPEPLPEPPPELEPEPLPERSPVPTGPPRRTASPAAALLETIMRESPRATTEPVTASPMVTATRHHRSSVPALTALGAAPEPSEAPIDPVPPMQLAKLSSDFAKLRGGATAAALTRQRRRLLTERLERWEWMVVQRKAEHLRLVRAERMASRHQLRAAAALDQLVPEAFVAWALLAFRARSAILRTAHLTQTVGAARRREELAAAEHATPTPTPTPTPMRRFVSAQESPAQEAAAVGQVQEADQAESEAEEGLGDVVLPEGVHWNSHSRWVVLFATRNGHGLPGEGDPYYYKPSRLPRTLSMGGDGAGGGDDGSDTEWDPPAEGVCGLGHGGHVWLFDTHV